MNSKVNNQQLEEYKTILIDAMCDEELSEMIISNATNKELDEIYETTFTSDFDILKTAYYFANLSSELVYDIVEHNNFVPMKLFKLMHKSSEIIKYHVEDVKELKEKIVVLEHEIFRIGCMLDKIKQMSLDDFALMQHNIKYNKEVKDETTD